MQTCSATTHTHKHDRTHSQSTRVGSARHTAQTMNKENYDTQLGTDIRQPNTKTPHTMCSTMSRAWILENVRPTAARKYHWHCIAKYISDDYVCSIAASGSRRCSAIDAKCMQKMFVGIERLLLARNEIGLDVTWAAVAAAAKAVYHLTMTTTLPPAVDTHVLLGAVDRCHLHHHQRRHSLRPLCIASENSIFPEMLITFCSSYSGGYLRARVCVREHRLAIGWDFRGWATGVWNKWSEKKAISCFWSWKNNDHVTVDSQTIFIYAFVLSAFGLHNAFTLCPFRKS